MTAASVTYFIGGDTGPVKIGRTTDLLRRLGELQVGSPVRLRVLGAVSLDYLRHDGDGDLPTFEGEIHRRLAGDRIHGEWFERSAARWAWDLVRQDQADYLVVDAWPWPRTREGA